MILSLLVAGILRCADLISLEAELYRLSCRYLPMPRFLILFSNAIASARVSAV
jgi:hypothetical protein